MLFTLNSEAGSFVPVGEKMFLSTVFSAAQPSMRPKASSLDVIDIVHGNGPLLLTASMRIDADWRHSIPIT